MSFDKNKCVIRKIYCGNGKVPKDTASKKYSRKGTNYECLKRGYGISEWNHRKKQLSINSLQQISYIGPVYEKRFKNHKICSIKSLIKKTGEMSAAEKKTLLQKVCKKSNDVIDQKAYNSVVLFLYEQGIKNLPECKIFKE